MTLTCALTDLVHFWQDDSNKTRSLSLEHRMQLKLRFGAEVAVIDELRFSSSISVLDSFVGAMANDSLLHYNAYHFDVEAENDTWPVVSMRPAALQRNVGNITIYESIEWLGKTEIRFAFLTAFLNAAQKIVKMRQMIDNIMLIFIIQF